MDQPINAYHRPVMVDEVLAYLAPAAQGWVVDGTYGGGGHSRALLRRHQDIRVVGIDRDPDARGQAIDDPRFIFVAGNHRDLRTLVAAAGAPERVDGILLDLGVSSHQLDDATRGFSYRQDGPLDMRMGPDAPRSAADLVNDADVDELARVIARFGEDPHARRIAAAIVAERPFDSTGRLADVIADAVPAAARRKRHPARRTFQALRIAVNDELAGLADALDGGIDLLAPGGRFVVIAYHSLEDRIVKRTFSDHARTCTCPPGLPACVCDASPDLRLVTRKGLRPGAGEVDANPRARSAVMRVAERISR